MRRSRFVLFATLTLALAGLASHIPAASGVAAGNWPQWRGPQRNGLSPDIGLLASWPQTGPTLAWTGKGLGAGFSSLAVVGGRIYTMGDRRDGQYVIALNEENGQPIWSTSSRRTETSSASRRRRAASGGAAACRRISAGG
jgi:outer membrane protein assembly factor BamB